MTFVRAARSARAPAFCCFPFFESHLGITPDGDVIDLATIRSRFSLKSAS